MCDKIFCRVHCADATRGQLNTRRHGALFTRGYFGFSCRAHAGQRPPPTRFNYYFLFYVILVMATFNYRLIYYQVLTSYHIYQL